MRMKSVAGLGIVVLATAMCMGASGGCGTDLKKAETSAGTIAATLHTAAQTNHTNTLESADDRKVIATYIAEAAAANDDFIGTLKTAESAGGKVDVTVIEKAFGKLLTRVNKLQSDGALHLKSAQARADFSIAMSTLQGALNVIQGLYPAQASAASGPLPPMPKHSPWGGIPLAGLVFTADEIEELIAMAVAVGSDLIPKLMALRGKTGGEILAGASADDLAAEQIAEEDGAPAPTA